MGEITAAAVKALRDRTGAGMMDCKKALVEAEGDAERALDLLRMTGAAKAAKRATRDASEGTVRIATRDGSVAMVEVLTETDFPMIRIQLKYDVEHAPIIRSSRRISKPGLRVYRKTADLKPVRGGLATQILTTSLGLMTDREARRRSIGGEVLCEVW